METFHDLSTGGGEKNSCKYRDKDMNPKVPE